MPALSLAPVLSFFAAFQRVSPVVPLQTFLRTTSNRLRPSPPRPFTPTIRHAQSTVLGSGRAGLHQLATVLHEPHPGSLPTIVLGGFVPDATEQVFLLRGHLAKSGSLYYVNYSPEGFSLDLLCAQLDDLTAEMLHLGQPPVILSVSFGGGILLEWLRRRQAAGSPVPVAGLVFVSPVACAADLLAPGVAKPASLLGRALQPYLKSTVDRAGIEKSRAIFARMFEAGAQNKAALAFLLTRHELAHLRTRVLGTIQRISATGACERVQTLLQMPALAPAGFLDDLLGSVPALILHAEQEEVVMVPGAPTRHALETAGANSGRCRVQVIANPGGPPVQHASLIFHCFNFLPPITAFYRRLKTGKIGRAA